MNLIIPPNLSLLPFQVEAVNSMLCFLKENKGCYNACEMGLGKSIQTIVTCNTLGFTDILIICPAIMVLVWEKEIAKWRVSKANNPDVEYTVISYNKAVQQKNLDYLCSVKWDCLILDEAHYCVEENTLISTEYGQKAIKDLKVGDKVWSSCINGLRLNRISYKFTGSPLPWHHFKLRDGRELKALQGHRILTQRGWVPSEKVKISDQMQVVRESVGCDLPFLGSRQGVLQPEMLKVAALSQRGMVQADAQSQPNEEAFSPFKNDSYSEKNWAQTENTRREWQSRTASRETHESIVRDGFSEGTSNWKLSSSAGEETERPPNLLQDRCGDSGIDACYRSGWLQSSVAKQKATGQEENEEITLVGLESITVHEPASTGDSSLRFEDLEVERDHNYIANGIIVHNCKSTKAKRTKTVLNKIWPCATYKIALSGTPFTRSIVDGYTLFHKFNPTAFPEYMPFCYRYAYVKRTPWGDKFFGVKHADELQAIIRNSFYVRYRKDEVLKDLPAKRFTRISLPSSFAVKPPEDEKVTLKEAIDAIKAKVERGEAIPVLPTALASIKRLQGQKKVAPISEFVLDLLAQEIPVVMFAYHTDVIKEYEEVFKKEEPAVVTGAVSQTNRQIAIERFQAGDTNLFIGQMVAAGVGITLTRSSTVILAELDYSPSNINQCCDRVHRIGVKGQVDIYHFPVEGSIDEDIIDNVMEKVKTFAKVLENTVAA